MIRRRSRSAVAVVVASLGLLFGVLAGCSSDGGDAGPLPTAGTLPDSTGDSCTDPTGDLDLPVGVSAEAPGLSGVDLVDASATVNGEQLDISITTAGPIDAAPAATYVVAQGDPLGALSFELRMVHGDDGWTTTLITWPDAKEKREQVAVTPVASGSTLTASIPTASLPTVALALQFGTSARIGDALVVDDCSSLAGG
ncbi:MAG TPA: hypothetical protein VIY72_03140 [Acidimicrobiales bacterium]